MHDNKQDVSREGDDAMMRLFDEGELGYFQRVRRMFAGLGMASDTREYKEARIELQRLGAPAAAVFLPIVCVLALVVLGTRAVVKERPIDTMIVEPVEKTKLDPVEPVKPPDPVNRVDVDVPVEAPPVTVDAPPAPDPQMSPQPTSIDSVAPVNSPLVFKDFYSSRSPGPRGDKIGAWNDAPTEGAVLAALRWLKKNQTADGSWGGNRIAMTGLGVLTFLAHGERPGQSPEFGETVQRAIQYLIDKQKSDGHFEGADDHEYAHPIAAYALCEAYGMTMNPNVGEAAARAITPIIAGQHDSGGWDYNMKPSDRADVSYMGWCAQALKAARLAKVRADGLDKAYKKCARGFKTNVTPEGLFAYAREDGKLNVHSRGLTAVGVLCLQLLGASGDPDCRKGLAVMDDWVPAFDAKPLGSSAQYYCYYATQARFFEGGQRWKIWNAQMKPLYVGTQKIEKGQYTYEGKPYDIGHWQNTDQHTDRPVMDTCLTALQLMVYYRNLPTNSDAAFRPDDGPVVTGAQIGDVPVGTPDNL